MRNRAFSLRRVVVLAAVGLAAAALSLCRLPAASAIVVFGATGVQITATEGVQASGVVVATFTHSNTALTASNFTSTINWGDGTPLTSGTVTGSTGSFTVTGTHTYAEETGAPFAVTVTTHDAANNFNAIANSTAVVGDAALLPGSGAAIGFPQQFSGVGGTNAAGGALNAMNAFRAAIGGIDNGGVASPQSGGLRTINWDAVALDGTDFGGSTTVISPSQVVGIPRNRFQARGALFDEVYAVAGNGFTSVNANAAGLFPAFSPARTFAMFNDNGIGLAFVLPGSPVTAPFPAAVRGFGAIFLNIRLPNTTSIEYFRGASSLGKFFAPAGSAGQPVFLGVLFSSAIVTRIQITCGTAVLFSFDGTSFSSNSSDVGGSNLVVTDDLVYSEPTSTAPSGIAATTGFSFSTVVGTFSDTDPNANSRDFTSTIDWGDGAVTPGVIAASATGFQVSGAHTYATSGTFRLTIDVADFGGGAVTLTNSAVVTDPRTILVAGADAGSEPRVRVYDAASRAKLFDFLAFEQKFKGGVRVAVGDLNGDGVPDIVAARGPGNRPEVRVFDGKTGDAFNGALGSFFAYDEKFKGGVFVAAGDVNGDGRVDIVTSPGPRIAPTVNVFSGVDGSVLVSFLGEAANYRRGITVAAGDINGDGDADIVTGAGPGSPPFVNVFNGATHLPFAGALGRFAAGDPKFKGGVSVAVGELGAAATPSIVVGVGPGAGPHVRVFSGSDGSFVQDFLAYSLTFLGGVRVAAGDVDGDGGADVVTGAGPRGGAEVHGFDGTNFLGIAWLLASDTTTPRGLWVAIGR